MEVTTKLLIFDADNGGQLEHIPFLVRSLERSAASAIIIEDKVGLKKNSFLFIVVFNLPIKIFILTSSKTRICQWI